MRRRIPRPAAWLLVLMWAAIIFGVSSLPGTSLAGGFSVEGHVGEYFVLGALLTLALSDERLDMSSALLAIVLASLYGVTDEFHQHFVPMRTPDVADWALDTVGAAIGALSTRALLMRSARKPLRD